MAREMIFTGRFLSAREALEIGLVNRCFPADQLLAKTRETATLIASKGRASLQAAKDAVRQGLNADLQTGLAIERDAFALCISSPDAQEGTSAFIEKRKAVFTGKRDS